LLCVALVGWRIYYVLFEIIKGDYTILFNFPKESGMTMFFYTSIVIGIFMVIFSYVKKGYTSLNEIKRQKLTLKILIIQLLYTFTWLAVTLGISVGITPIITAINSLFPAITVILALIFYKEKLVLNQKIGILTILIGLVLISI